MFLTIGTIRNNEGSVLESFFQIFGIVARNGDCPQEEVAKLVNQPTEVAQLISQKNALIAGPNPPRGFYFSNLVR